MKIVWRLTVLLVLMGLLSACPDQTAPSSGVWDNSKWDQSTWQ